MSTDNGNEIAFPFQSRIPHFGLTKREYFAAMAMQGLLANSDSDIASLSTQTTIKVSIEHADELLKQLENPQL